MFASAVRTPHDTFIFPVTNAPPVLTIWTTKVDKFFSAIFNQNIKLQPYNNRINAETY